MITERHLHLLSEKIFKLLHQRNVAIDIFLLKNDEIARLKSKFIEKKAEPNILSFPEPSSFPHPETKKRYLGEIYLNKDILKKSPERTVPLLIHGILHLLGYSHERKADFVKMERLEKKILAQYGKQMDARQRNKS